MAKDWFYQFSGGRPVEAMTQYDEELARPHTFSRTAEILKENAWRRLTYDITARFDDGLWALWNGHWVRPEECNRLRARLDRAVRRAVSTAGLRAFESVATHGSDAELLREAVLFYWRNDPPKADTPSCSQT